MINARCVCGHFSFIHSADIWQSSLTPLFSIRQACSTQQVAAEIVSRTAETLNATQDVGSSPYRTPFNYPLKSLLSPFYIFNTPDWPYATKSDTCINVV